MPEYLPRLMMALAAGATLIFAARAALNAVFEQRIIRSICVDGLLVRWKEHGWSYAVPQIHEWKDSDWSRNPAAEGRALARVSVEHATREELEGLSRAAVAESDKWVASWTGAQMKRRAQA